MNARPVSALVLAAVLSVSASSPSFAASRNDVAVVYPLNTVTVTSNGDMKVVRGMYRGDVSWAMKYDSHEELSTNVWAFSGYHANLDLPDDQNCGTLIITFKDDKVVDLQLVNKPAVAVITASLKVGSPSRNLAKK